MDKSGVRYMEVLTPCWQDVGCWLLIIKSLKYIVLAAILLLLMAASINDKGTYENKPGI